MLVVLDSNDIFALGPAKDPACIKLLDKIAENIGSASLRITRMIIEEVRNNLTPEAFKEFITAINGLTNIDEDTEVPFEIGVKYQLKGLKYADAFIAAYTEWVGADILVTENRHFLSRRKDLPFKVVGAKEAIKLIK